MSLNDRVCDPFTSTAAPQKHVRGWQTSTPKRKLTTTLTASSSRRSALDVMGKTLSQSALCVANVASSQASS